MTTAAALYDKIEALEAQSAAKDAEIARLAAAQGVVGNSLDLTLDGAREMLDEERSRQLFAPVLDDSEAGDQVRQRVTKVRLGTKSFGREAAAVAAEALGRLPNLTHVDLADIIAGRMEEEALEVLKIMCGALPTTRVCVLDLSDNALGEKGVRALEPVLRALGKVQRLRFHNNGLSELAVQLLAGYCPAENLLELSFHNNMSGNGGAQALGELLARCPSIEALRMSSSRVRSEGGCALIQALEGRTALRELDLSDSMLGEEGAEQLETTLRSLTGLVKLSLRDTGLDDGIEQVLDALTVDSSCPMLRELNLSALDIPDERVDAIMRVVSVKPHLSVLDLDENELGSDGAVMLASQMTALAATQGSKMKLSKLSLRTNQVGSAGAMALTRLVAAVSSLACLELDDNTIAEGTVRKMQAVLNKVGKASALGSLEENDPEGDEDEEEQEQEGEEEELTAMMGAAKLT